MDESTSAPDPVDPAPELEARQAAGVAAFEAFGVEPVADPLWPPHELPGGQPAHAWQTPAARITPLPAGGRTRGGWGQVVGAAVLGAALTVTTLAVAGVFDRSADQPVVSTGNAAEIHQIVREDARNLATAVGRKVTPSVVAVEVGLGADDLFRAIGGGSGVILDHDGVIVTNAHVIEASDNIRVVLHDGRIYPAEVLGSDADTDLAVLRITGGDLIPIDLGTTDNLDVGDAAIAVGNPLGLSGGSSLTVGVISAFDREVTAAGASATLYGMVQTDAPITQGSSGGALVDHDGHLVGITTAIGVSTAGAEGIGFAIPVELMRRVTDELLSDGAVRRPFLGVELANETQQRSDGGSEPAGALVAGFAPQAETAAQSAGIQQGDVIVALDGRIIVNREQLIAALRYLRVGDAVELDLVRDGAPLSVRVVLGEQDTSQ